MFEDNQTDQSQDNQQQPDVGIGTHPSIIQQNPQPQVVLPNPGGVPPTDDTTSSVKPTVSDDLESIKQQALTELSPLVDKLDQSPEEKYKILMMMIQATDNQDLISEAFHCAQQITDDKARGTALLSIINEIDYLNQKEA